MVSTTPQYFTSLFVATNVAGGEAATNNTCSGVRTLFSAPVPGILMRRRENDVFCGLLPLAGMGRMRHTVVGHKIGMTGKLVRYGVEISQLVLDMISLQWEGEQKLTKKDDRKIDFWREPKNCEIAVFLLKTMISIQR
jgi:hypothetical protein